MDQRLPFADRADAGRRLATALARFRGSRPLVLAIPRGAVPMARLVADALDGTLDVVLVRKLAAPGDPELAVGSVDERGEVVVDAVAADWSGADDAWLDAEAARQRALIARRRRRYGAGRPPAAIVGRTVIVVDDGLATGATMLAALRAVRARRPARLVCAVPVASARGLARVTAVADETVCLATPTPFAAVGAYYRDFPQVEDAEVLAALAAPPGIDDDGDGAVACAYRVHVRVDGVSLEAALVAPPHPVLLAIVAHGAGSSRHEVRHRRVEDALRQRGCATLLVDLLTPAERDEGDARFDIALLVRRLEAAMDPARREPAHRGLPVVLYGVGNGAAAALALAARRPAEIRAVVSRGGRPDLAGVPALSRVRAPTLLVVGGTDTDALAPNLAAADALGKRAEVVMIPGGTRLLREREALDRLAGTCADWLARVVPQPRAGDGAPRA